MSVATGRERSWRLRPRHTQVKTAGFGWSIKRNARVKHRDHAARAGHSGRGRTSRRGSIARAVLLPVALVLVMTEAPAIAAPNSASPETARKGGAALARGDTGQAITYYTTALADTALANDRRAMILNDRRRLCPHRQDQGSFRRLQCRSAALPRVCGALQQSR